ncbi:MAG: hypothetical protein IT442_14800 [Phycisphaeraceae bacterium]|nr:hypothetical protein [Phycisphaeraceae bacterium]
MTSSNLDRRTSPCLSVAALAISLTFICGCANGGQRISGQRDDARCRQFVVNMWNCLYAERPDSDKTASGDFFEEMDYRTITRIHRVLWEDAFLQSQDWTSYLVNSPVMDRQHFASMLQDVLDDYIREKFENAPLADEHRDHAATRPTIASGNHGEITDDDGDRIPYGAINTLMTVAADLEEYHLNWDLLFRHRLPAWDASFFELYRHPSKGSWGEFCRQTEFVYLTDLNDAAPAVPSVCARVPERMILAVIRELCRLNQLQPFDGAVAEEMGLFVEADIQVNLAERQP